MKFSILQQDLLPIITSVARSAGVRSTLPVLSNLLLATDGEYLKIAATNLEVGIIKKVKAEGAEHGEITVPAKTLVELISSLGPNQIEVDVVGEVVNIKSGKFRSAITGINSTEFPVIPKTEEKGIIFKKEVLKSCTQIIFASAIDEGRPTLTGILTEISAGNLSFVATDGFRLAYRKVKIDSNASFKNLIPRRTFEEILRLIDEEAVEEIEISTSKDKNQALFKVGTTELSSRLIEGNFPTWEKIIPTEIKTRALIDRVSLHQAIKLASVFAKSEANIVTFKVTKEAFAISSEAKEVGSQTNEIDSQTEGEDIEISFNIKFLLDCLAASNSSQVMMEFSGPLSAALIKPVGEEGLEYIVMPVRA